MRIAGIILSMSLLTSLVARADPPSPPAVESAPNNWYGWQLLGTDTLAFGLLASSHFGLLPDSAGSLGAIGYMVDGVVIHGVHHRPAAGLLSVGLRFLGPIVGAALVIAQSSCPTERSGDALSFDRCASSRELGSAMIAGMVTAALLDATLAREVGTPGERHANRGDVLTFSPYLVADAAGGSLGVVLSF